MTRPRFWPHLLIEEGPSVAGLDVGDTIALVPGYHVVVKHVASAAGWRTPSLVVESNPPWTGRPAVGDARRFNIETRRLEHARFAIADADGADTSDAKWQPTSDRMQVGPWRVRFIDDGPPLATVKTIVGRRVAHASVVDEQYGTGCQSRWMSVASPKETRIVVYGSSADDVSVREIPRRKGAPVNWLREIAGGDIDPEIAAGIVAQTTHAFTTASVGFDGVVRVDDLVDPITDKSALDHFAALVCGARDAGVGAEREGMARRLEATRAATVSEISDVIRALLPLEWAREQALLEEIALLT